MSDRNYLYRVLGLSALPRVLTFVLSLVSFPIMLRGVGAAEYGVMVYLGSLVSLVELMAGVGVGAALSKRLSECRTSRPAELRVELRAWSRLQVAVCAASVLPVFALATVALRVGDGPQVPSGLLPIVLGSLYVTTLLGFARAALSSMLAFRRLAVLDGTDSVLRSIGWICVGLYQPTVWALAWVALAGSMLTLTLGVALLRIQMRAYSADPDAVTRGGALTTRAMLRESASFLALTSGTRAFGALPVLLIGRLLGFEATGVLGAFAKVMEIFSLPFTILGNALMVRAPEIKALGTAALKRYWDMLFRLVVVAFAVAAAFWFVHSDVARLLLPSSRSAGELFVLLSPYIFARCVSDLFAPAADYVGGLRSRIILLWSFALVQLPAIWLASRSFGTMGALAATVVTYALMVCGYLAIAAKVFFEREPYRLPNEVQIGFLLTICASAAAASLPMIGPVRGVVFIVLTLTAFAAVPTLRRAFAPTRLIQLELA